MKQHDLKGIYRHPTEDAMGFSQYLEVENMDGELVAFQGTPGGNLDNIVKMATIEYPCRIVCYCKKQSPAVRRQTGQDWRVPETAKIIVKKIG